MLATPPEDALGNQRSCSSSRAASKISKSHTMKTSEQSKSPKKPSGRAQEDSIHGNAHVEVGTKGRKYVPANTFCPKFEHLTNNIVII